MSRSDEIEGAFRRAMRRFAATVSVLSARDGERRCAMTATAVTSLSMAPPSLLACVYGQSRFHRVLAVQDQFCVNILHRDQSSVSHACARPLAAGDHGFGWFDHGAFSCIAGAQAAILCRKAREVPFGSHTIFIGTVVDVIVRDEVAPLLFQDGQYGTCMPLSAAEAGIA